MENEQLKKRSFCVELKSKGNLKNVSLTDSSEETVLIEGSIGELRYAGFVEDVMLEIVGEEGVLRVDIAKHEIKQLSGGDADGK